MVTMISWSASTLCSHATTSIRYDISEMSSSADGAATTAPAPSNPTYTESNFFDIDIPLPVLGDLKFKLKVDASPDDWATTHTTAGSLYYSAEVFGTLGGTTILAETPQWIFKGDCNPSTGFLTPSDSHNSTYVNPPPNSNPVSAGSSSYRVYVDIEDKNIDPPGGGSEIILTGNINARLQSQAAAGNWVDKGSTAKVPFKLTIISHQHP
jgi:hypothetical protein